MKEASPEEVASLSNYISFLLEAHLCGEVSRERLTVHITSILMSLIIEGLKIEISSGMKKVLEATVEDKS